jgi:hypothetical protein
MEYTEGSLEQAVYFASITEAARSLSVAAKDDYRVRDVLFRLTRVILDRPGLAEHIYQVLDLWDRPAGSN